MKKFFLFISLCTSLLFWRWAASDALAQTISFPTPELRVDTVKPLNTYGVTFMRPTTMVNKLTIKGNRIPPTFYFQIMDSIGYNRFGVTKNGMLVAGTHHDPQVNLDGLGIWGRRNALKGADAFAIGKGVYNDADSAMALGYHYTVPADKYNHTVIGYGNNRIEMNADSGRFVGNWKIGAGSYNDLTDKPDPFTDVQMAAINSGITLQLWSGLLKQQSDYVTLQSFQTIYAAKSFRSSITTQTSQTAYPVNPGVSIANHVVVADNNNGSTIGDYVRLTANKLRAEKNAGGDVKEYGLEASGFYGSGTTAGTSASAAGKLVVLNPSDGKIDPNYYNEIYTQAAEPDIPSDTFAFWVNTADQTFWIILDSSGTQKKMQLQ